MKKSILLLRPLFLAVTVLGLNVARVSHAETFTIIKSFSGSDGVAPNAGLVLSGRTLYGTTYYGGSSNLGTVFKVNTDGSNYTVLKNFTGSDGANPHAVLIVSGSTLYGTTAGGGSSGEGTVFKVNTDGLCFTNLHSFNALDNQTNSDGANPYAGLILSGSTLYGTTAGGGSSGKGTVFKVNTNGLCFTNLHSFSGLDNPTKSDGAHPKAGLILSGGTLYGTTERGGSSDHGTVFKVNTNGLGYTVLANFAFSNGAYPRAGLVLSGSTLYGTTYVGGSSGYGAVFKVNTNGSGFTNVYSFSALDPNYSTNSNGGVPEAGLVLSGRTLYGTTLYGGSSSCGTVFKVNTNGSGFANLYSFSGLANHTNSNGAHPKAGLILSDSTLYGTTSGGGNSGCGTVFALRLSKRFPLWPF